MATEFYKRMSLLSSGAVVQAPWIKVTFGEKTSGYTFGVYNKATKIADQTDQGFYTSYKVQYPNYITDLTIDKINGQINQYSLSIRYPVRPQDDPNFFEKIFSSISKTRKIIFSYGDSSTPNYAYKDEEAIITDIQQSFGFGSGGSHNSEIGYTIRAVSSASLAKTGSFTFLNAGKKKPSDEIKRLFKNTSYGLQSLFTGMNINNLDLLIAGDDAAVEIASKTNITILDYILYLVSCMVPASNARTQLSKDIYILTIHDESIYDTTFQDKVASKGPYFKVSKVSYAKNYPEAYEIDIGYNTSTIVSNFNIENNESYSIFYDYNTKLYPQEYTRRLNNKGQWEDVFAPSFTASNEVYKTRAEDISWYTKLTKYPINATITIQGLLRPAMLMTYLRLNVIFPGGHKHISSGLYIVTKQKDSISGNGFKTTLNLTRISGDTLSES